MKLLHTTLLRSVLLLGLVGALALAACSANTPGKTSTGTHATGGGSASATPTATKPTSLPTITVPYCQSILSVSQSNQLMNPAMPTTKIEVENGSEINSCDYESDASVYGINLLISFEVWKGPTPIPQQDITAFVVKLSHSPNGTVTTFTNVSGVGDQAAFLAVTTTSSSSTLKIDVFYVLYGKVFFVCANPFNVGSSPDATQQSALQQCAQAVVSRL